jgi:hypothetical protein
MSAPAHSTASAFTAWVARLAAVAVAAGAVVGSSAHLLEIATEAGMVAPWSLPVGLDCVALAAAAARRWHRDDPYARRALAAAVMLSAALQVADAFHIPVNVLAPVLYAVPPLAAWLAFEMFLRASETAVPHTPPTAARRPKRPAPPAPAPVQTPATSATARAGATSNGTARKGPARSLDELMPVAERVAAGLIAEGRTLSRRALNDGIRAETGRGLDPTRAGELVKRLDALNPTTLAPEAAPEAVTDAEPVPAVEPVRELEVVR